MNFNMAEGYRQNPTFDPSYLYPDRITGKNFKMPLEMAAFGLNLKGLVAPYLFLGIGQLIGSIDLHPVANNLHPSKSSVVPVIEIRDIKDGQLYTLLGAGHEVELCHPGDGLIDDIEAGIFVIRSVRDYIKRRLPRKMALTVSDTVWLEGNNIKMPKK
jgi:hypothetical protein